MTKQIRDILLYNNDEYYLNEEYLENYFKEFQDQKPKIESCFTALWRGYIATFEIRDEQLFVKDIRMYSDPKLNLKILNDLFPNNNKFEWFSGLIRIDAFRGEYDDEHPDAIFKFLEILNGNLKNVWELNYEDFQAFKELQFEYFKGTESYNKLYSLWRNNNPKMPDSEIDKYISEGIIRNSKELF